MYENLGEFVLFLNDDVEIGDNFYEDIIKPFSDQKVAIVGNHHSSKIWGVNGAIMCIRRDIFEKIGGFDEDYFFMWEDRDICENVRRRGYKIAISDANATHEGGRSTKINKFYNANFSAGKKTYEKKWLDKDRIIGAMIIGDEAGKYLEIVIPDLFRRRLIDELVIVMDCPTDKTPEIIGRLKEDYQITAYHHNFKLFGTAENLLRKRLVEYAISKNPYGILAPDADEVFDESFSRKKAEKLLSEGIAWDFKIAHFWGDFEHVRVDGKWRSQKNIRLFKYLSDKQQDLTNFPIHSGSAPRYAYHNRKLSPFILKHYGYIKRADVDKKIERYKKFDPIGLYESIDLYNQMKDDGSITKFNKAIYANS